MVVVVRCITKKAGGGEENTSTQPDSSMHPIVQNHEILTTSSLRPIGFFWVVPPSSLLTSHYIGRLQKKKIKALAQSVHAEDASEDKQLSFALLHRKE